MTATPPLSPPTSPSGPTLAFEPRQNIVIPVCASRDPGGPSPRSRGSRVVVAVLLTLVGVAVAAIILSPAVLSSRDLFDWAAAPTGLGLRDQWPFLVILSLDAAATACVLMSILCTWLGERPGLFAILIWVFAGTSAIANWRHAALTPHSPHDAIWFFPLMSLLGPGILHVVLTRVRGWLRNDTTASTTVAVPAGHRWQRWVPGLGSFTDTFGAYRTLLLTPALTSFTEAVTEYQQLCPDGSLRVAKALRRRNLTRTHAAALTALHLPAPTDDGSWPVDLMRRIPVHTDAYQRWRSAWNDLKNTDNPAQDNDNAQHRPTTQAIADQHDMSLRQLQFVRRAGELGLLDSPIPPAVRLAQLHTATPDSP